MSAELGGHNEDGIVVSDVEVVAKVMGLLPLEEVRLEHHPCPQDGGQGSGFKWDT